MVDVILGLQWGDEGKGKIVDYFASRYNMVARYQGGPNAGHTIYVNGEKVVLHQVPSGIFHENIQNIIGNGVVLDPIMLKDECKTLSQMGADVKKNLFISKRANLILPTHRALDKANELAKGKGKIGSTLKGMGPAYTDKAARNALRIGDIEDPHFITKYISIRLKHQQQLEMLGFHEDITEWEENFLEAIEYLRGLNIVNSEYFVNDRLSQGKNLLAEGAQGTMLDVDFGTYPFVTSSNTTSSGVCNGLGIAPGKVREIIGISKAYCTRVGSGPFPTELFDQTGEQLRTTGGEFGATTGRPRRCGWMDLVALKYACMLNGATQIVMTKADVLDKFEELKACTQYKMEDGSLSQEIPYRLTDQVTPEFESFKGWNTDSTKFSKASELPEAIRKYTEAVSKYTGTPVKYICNGPGRDQIIEL